MKKAVANEIPMAMLRVGEYYLYDYDSLNESEKAFAYFKKAAEYEWYSEGLGICYEMGIGVKRMKRKPLNIIHWLRIMEIRQVCIVPDFAIITE